MTGKTTGREGAPAEELHHGAFNELEFKRKKEQESFKKKTKKNPCYY